MNREYRAMEIRASDEPMHVTGYAAVYNEQALLWESSYSGYRYYERIAAGAFDGTDMSDVIMRYNHGDSALILARTANHTLELVPDERGLRISATLADTTMGRDIFTLIQRGDISKMSFAFTVEKSSNEEDEANKTCIRTIQKFKKVYDVAPVDVPAYDGTSLEARSKAYFEELERRKREQQIRQRLIIQTYL